MAEPCEAACDHAFTTTRLRGGRFVRACRCGTVISIDILPQPPERYGWHLEDAYVQRST